MRDTTGGGHDGAAIHPCLFLLFEAGGRPSSSDVRAALQASKAALVSYDPARQIGRVSASDWIEVLIDGLTFDILGLEPGPSLVAPPAQHTLGATKGAFAACEAIGIAPGPHLASAANAQPVLRTLLGLGSTLMTYWPSCLGALWHPAATVSQRDIFIALIDDWLAGGPFPSLCLTGVIERADQRLASDGLAFFVGREVILDPLLTADRIAATRLIVRLIDHLIENRDASSDGTATLAGGERYRLALSGGMISVMPA